MSNLKVLIVQPDGLVEYRTIVNGPVLADFQRIVDGYIESVTGDGWHLYCNEEGKLRGLPINMVATKLAHELFGHNWRNTTEPYFDILVGNVVFIGNAPDGEEADVPQYIVGLAEEIAYGDA